MNDLRKFLERFTNQGAEAEEPPFVNISLYESAKIMYAFFMSFKNDILAEWARAPEGVICEPPLLQKIGAIKLARRLEAYIKGGESEKRDAHYNEAVTAFIAFLTSLNRYLIKEIREAKEAERKAKEAETKRYYNELSKAIYKRCAEVLNECEIAQNKQTRKGKTMASKLKNRGGGAEVALMSETNGEGIAEPRKGSEVEQERAQEQIRELKEALIESKKWWINGAPAEFIADIAERLTRLNKDLKGALNVLRDLQEAHIIKANPGAQYEELFNTAEALLLAHIERLANEIEHLWGKADYRESEEANEKLWEFNKLEELKERLFFGNE